MINEFNSFADFTQHFAPISDDVLDLLKNWVLFAAATSCRLSKKGQRLLMDGFENIRFKAVTIPAPESISVAAICHARLRGSEEAQEVDVDGVLNLFTSGEEDE
ncbi:hypothetical protein RCL1_003066 [Eukaryota sp. TZLM3-RCL]